MTPVSLLVAGIRVSTNTEKPEGFIVLGNRPRSFCTRPNSCTLMDKKVLSMIPTGIVYMVYCVSSRDRQYVHDSPLSTCTSTLAESLLEGEHV